jgi:NAD-dependent dihydropyrimidine dehydrogenase PreA subunit
VSLFKTIWGLLFRLFPCPTPTGLRPVGNPGPDSPVLLTCNFDLTVKRLLRALKGVDAWLLVAESRGVNVWCAAGGDEFNTRSAVSALKTSGVEERVSHRMVVLPPLAAPGICAAEVREQTGWKIRWGPVRANDIPAFLEKGCRRDGGMKRVTYSLVERLDTALGSMFLFYLLGALGLAVFATGLLSVYLLTSAATFLFFMAACPYIPGRRGMTKVLVLEGVLGIGLAATEILRVNGGLPLREVFIIAMVMLLVFGAELGGLSPTMKSEFDPFLARLGVGAVGNAAFAGTVRTELLNGYRKLSCDRDACIGCRNCVELCPLGLWEMDGEKKARLAREQDCTACRACITQCRSGAIRAQPPLLNGTPGCDSVFP